MAYNFPKTNVKIQSQTASNSATIDFTSVITSNFQTYMVRFLNVVPITISVQMQILFSTNNGGAWLGSAYLWSTFTTLSNATNVVNDSAADSSCTLVTGLVNTASVGISGTMMLFDMNNGTLVPKFYFDAATVNATPNAALIWGGGMNSGTTAITAIRFQMSSGNISSGTFVLYGVTEP
jgi:hypothetical protein